MNYALIAVIVIIYLGITAFLGYLGYRNTKKGSASDYLVAGRKTHPAIMAISYGATFISTSAIVGFGGAAAVYGMGILWLTVLNIFIGIFVAFVVFGLRTRKMGHNLDAHTFPELLGRRFDSQFLQASAGLMIFVAMPLYAGSVIIGGTNFLTQTLKIPYEWALIGFVVLVAAYVVFGGLKGVMYTDAFQGALMFVGMVVLLIGAYAITGGFPGAHDKLTALAPEAKKIWGGAGSQGWTAMPVTGSVFWQQLVTTIVMGVGIGVLAQPQLVVRFMTVKSGHELNRAVLVGGIFIMMMTGVAFVVGALSNVYFNETMGKVSILAANKNTDNIIPLFIDKAMPQWFTALFMVTLLAAAMSTLSGQFHAMGTAFGRDFLENGLKIKAKNSTAVTKIAMGVGILLAAILALFLPKFFEQGSAIIAIGTSIFFGLCAAAFLPMFVGALYVKGMSKVAALASFFSGIGSALIWMVFFHMKEAKSLGLCKLLFGSDALVPSWANIDPIVISLPISVVVIVVVGLLTKPPRQEVVDKAFAGVK